MMVRIVFLVFLAFVCVEVNAGNHKKVAVVTGGAEGIGKGVVDALVLDGGYIVYGTTRQQKRVGHYKNYQLVRMDPGDTASVDAAIGQIVKDESRIDVLINSAGYLMFGSVESIDPDKELLDMMNVNVVGYVRTTRAVLPSMRKNKSGLIINITSSQAFEPRALMEGYSSTRAAVEAISLGQSAYLKEYGVKVVVFEPGATNTDIGKNAVIGSKVVEGDVAGRRAQDLNRMMGERLSKGADVTTVAARILDVVHSGGSDFRTPVNDKVKERAAFVYREPAGNQLRDKLLKNYQDFVLLWGTKAGLKNEVRAKK